MRAMLSGGVILAAALASVAHLAGRPAVPAPSASPAQAQATPRPTPTPRLPADVLAVTPPSNRVAGAPGSMKVTGTTCPAGAALTPALRQRLVDIAVQEWAFFGYGIVDQTIGESDDEPRPPPGGRRGRPRIEPAEGARVAASIGGYWAVTPEGGWIVDRQNATWDSRGTGARWNSPWSAAFISWMMCEAGLGDASVFQRSVAHHRYIDQAIRARDDGARQPAFLAHDGGDAEILPGDLLCSGRRPAYRSLAERRRQLGESASTHCDLVVTVDTERRRFLAIGGNVRSAVTLKVIPGEWDAVRERLRPFRSDDPRIGNNAYRGVRPIFAHLQLRAGQAALDGLAASATVRSLACGETSLPAPLARLVPERLATGCPGLPVSGR